jgi:hypothetical protein
MVKPVPIVLRLQVPIAVDVLFTNENPHYNIHTTSPDKTTAARTPNEGTTGMQSWGPKSKNAVAHEVGHMLGNKDEYGKVDGVDYTKKPPRNIMNNVRHDPVAEHFHLIAKKADKGCSVVKLGTSCKK